ncbi:MAG: RIP metalloprotease [Actinobacteria bacterium]|nr:RIP metalloprotease [Actinomycetota bacterium]
MKDPLEDVQLSETRGGSFVVLGVVVALVALLFFVNPWVAAIIVGLIVMVMLHEAGHLIAARKTGMLATEYFLGFGPRLWSFKKGETEYGVKAIPAGGYVRIIGMTNMEEVPPEDERRTYRVSSTGRRLTVVLAGVTVNILLAWLLFTVAIAGRGYWVEGPSTTVRQVVANSAAAAAGVEAGDRFVAVDGQPVDSWDDLKGAIEANGGEETTFVVVRDGERVTLTATPESRGGQGFLGVAPGDEVRDITILGAIPEGFKAIGRVTSGTVSGVARVFSPSGVQEYSKNFTSDAPKEGSPADLNRPTSVVGIVDKGSSLVAGDVWSLLFLLGAVSLALALFNLIPLPPFDGGHAAVVVYEAIASKVKGRTVRADWRKLMPVAAVVLAIFFTFGLSAMLLDLRDIAR